MEGTPAAAMGLLRYARHLSSQNAPRLSALAFASAASCRGVSPRVQARALYAAASQLYVCLQLPAPPPLRAEDSARAVQLLRKCAVLLRNIPDAAPLRLAVAALLERIHTAVADHAAAARAIRAAMELLSRAVAMQANLVAHWWAYFQCRAIANARARQEHTAAVVRVARDSALQAAKHADLPAAVAFALTEAQVAMSDVTPHAFDVSAALRVARDHIAALSSRHTHAQTPELVYLTFCYYILQGLDYIRTGDLRGAHANLVRPLRKSYDRLRLLQQDRNNKPALWRWLPSQVMTAVTCHIIIATNPNEHEKRKDMYPLTSLTKLGIHRDSFPSFRRETLKIGELAPSVSSTLAAVFFETAARIRLTSIDLDRAAPLVTAAVNAIFDDDEARAEVKLIEAGRPANPEKILPPNLPVSQVLARCAALLLASQYYYLFGTIPAAKMCQEFLRIALLPARRFKDSDGNGLVSDGWQMAQSLLSLLTGRPRPGSLIPTIPKDKRLIEAHKRNGLDSRFTNKRVLGMAWFAIGVFQMRKNEVLESRKALQNALSGLMDIASENDQVVANATAVMSGLTLNHERIGDIAPEMINSAITMSEAMDDSVTLCRALRQYKKWVIRSSQDFHNKETAGERARLAYDKLREKQQGAGHLLFADPR